MNIDIIVADKVARAPLDAEIVCGNKDYTVTFDFDKEWDNHPVKTARFTYIKRNKVRYEDVVFEGRVCNVPLLSNITRVDIGVFAGDLRTTTAAIIKCKRSILCGGGVPEEPTEEVYNQIINLFNEKILDPSTPIDQTFDPESENPQSGKALCDVVIKTVNSPKIWELDAGVYRVSGAVMYATPNPPVEPNTVYLINKVGFLIVGLNPSLNNQRDFYLFAEGKIYFGYSVAFEGIGEMIVNGAISGEFSKVAKEISTASTPDEIPTAEAVVEYVQSVIPPSAEGVEY